MGCATHCEEPTARNSNRLPQNAKGAVRLRSSRPRLALSTELDPNCSSLPSVLYLNQQVVCVFVAVE